MERISERELILPSLYLLEKEDDKELSTTQLITKLRGLLNPEGEDLSDLEGRPDDKFSQKVRNLRSHKTLEKEGYTIYNEGKFKITVSGKRYLSENPIFLSEIILVENYFEEFNNSIEIIRNLCEKITFEEDLVQHFYNMLYSSVITSLETYLSDALRFKITNDEKYLKLFVETFREYEKEKFTFKEVFNQCENILFKVKEDISKLMYHNLSKIKGIYKSTFDIEFNDISGLAQSIVIRHDLVHRNGKNKEGVNHNISKNDVLNLCSSVSGFIVDIETKFNIEREV